MNRGAGFSGYREAVPIAGIQCAGDRRNSMPLLLWEKYGEIRRDEMDREEVSESAETLIERQRGTHKGMRAATAEVV